MFSKSILSFFTLAAVTICNVCSAGEANLEFTFDDIAESKVLEGGRVTYGDAPILSGEYLFVAAGEVGGSSVQKSTKIGIWKTSGTFETTTKLADAYDISTDAYKDASFVRIDEEAMIVILPEPGALGLWVTDGTVLGTRRLTHTFIGGDSPLDAQNAYYHNGILYFSATSGNDQRELWKAVQSSPGSYEITQVADINSTGSSDPSDFASIGSLTYFAADDGTIDRELWVTDGTSAGTHLVMDISVPGTESRCIFGGDGSRPKELIAVGDWIYFSACGLNRVGRQFWRSKGDVATTERLTRLSGAGANGSSSPSNLRNLVKVGESIYMQYRPNSNASIPPLFGFNSVVLRYDTATQNFGGRGDALLASRPACRVNTYGPALNFDGKAVLSASEICFDVRFDSPERETPIQLFAIDQAESFSTAISSLGFQSVPSLSRFAISSDKRKLFYVTSDSQNKVNGVTMSQNDGSESSLFVRFSGSNAPSEVVQLFSINDSVYVSGRYGSGRSAIWRLEESSNEEFCFPVKSANGNAFAVCL